MYLVKYNFEVLYLSVSTLYFYSTTFQREILYFLLFTIFISIVSSYFDFTYKNMLNLLNMVHRYRLKGPTYRS